MLINAKGQGLSLSTVILGILGVLVLIVLATIVTSGGQNVVDQGTACTTTGGSCFDTSDDSIGCFSPGNFDGESDELADGVLTRKDCPEKNSDNEDYRCCPTPNRVKTK